MAKKRAQWKAPRTTRERRLIWAVVALGSVCAAIVTVVLVRLWSETDGNVAGWVTTFVVFGAAWVLWEALGLEDGFRRSSRRTQWFVIALMLVLAIAGSLIYVLLPGTASWYLASLPAIPALLVVLSFRSEESTPSGGFSDGPWSAP